MSLIELTDTERKLAGRIAPSAGQAIALSPQAGGISFTNADQAMEFAKMMALSNTGVRPHLRGNPGACLAIVVQAVEWGISPYAVANKSYFVNNQIAFESQLIQAVILRRAPIKGRLKFDYVGDGDDMSVRVWARLRDEQDEIVEYVSPKIREIQPRNSPLWKSDRPQQLAYYGGRALCRRHFPDVILGIYAPDELEAGMGHDAPRVSGTVAPMRGLQSKLDALAADEPARAEPAEVEDGQVVEHDASTPVLDETPASGPDYEPLLADLQGKLEAAETLEEIQAAADEAGWVVDAPPAIQERANAAVDEEKTRIAQQTARDAPDPHADLRATARKKAGEGKAKLKRWSGTISLSDFEIIEPMMPELDGIAVEADKTAGRA